MTSPDALRADTVTYQVTPTSGIDLKPLHVTANGELDDRVAAVSAAVEARLGQSATVTDDGYGVVFPPQGAVFGRFIVTELA